MSILYPGRVYQTSTTTGTGALTLSGSSSAALTWQSKFGAGPVPVLYLIQGTTYFEMGRGVFTAASALTRVDVYSSSNSDALVVLPSATHDVFAWLPGEARYTVSFPSTKTLAISEWATIQQFTGGSAATLNLPAKASMPGGFHCTIQNDGTANLTIDPSGSETVEGSLTLIVRPGQFGELSYDGTIWRFKSTPGVTSGSNPSVATGVPTTIFTMAGTTGLYLVWGNIQVANVLGTYFSWAVVAFDSLGPSAAVLGGANASTSTITVSGSNIRYTQNSGVNQTIEWSVMKLSA